MRINENKRGLGIVGMRVLIIMVLMIVCLVYVISVMLLLLHFLLCACLLVVLYPSLAIDLLRLSLIWFVVFLIF